MNPFELMELKKDSFTNKEVIIYNLVLENVNEILRGTLNSIAPLFNVSPSSITRFCQKLGYSGYNDFKFELYKYEKQSLVNQDNNIDGDLLDHYAALIKLIKNSFTKEDIENLANAVIKSNTVMLTGYHKSFLPCKFMETNLRKLSKSSIAIANDSFEDINFFATKDDLLIIFSAEGTSVKEILDIATSQKKYKVALITMNSKSSYKNKVDFFIWLPSSKNQHYPVYLENQVIFFIFVDILTAHIAKQNNNKNSN